MKKYRTHIVSIKNFSIVLGLIVSVCTVKPLVLPIGADPIVTPMIKNTATLLAAPIGLVGKYAYKRYCLHGCKDNLERVVRLFEYGYEDEAKRIINTPDECGITPLKRALFFEDDFDRAKWLLQHGAKKSINIVKGGSWSLLMSACHSNDMQRVRWLLKHGAKKTINVINLCGRTALYFACEDNDIEMVKLLLQHGAQPSVNIASEKYDDNKTPLWWACYHGNIELILLLLENGAGASVNVADAEHNRSPFWLACSCLNKESFIEIVKLLLEKYGAGELVNVADTMDNKTPFWLAVRNGCLEIAQLLLEKYGASINIVDTEHKKTPLLVVCDRLDVLRATRIKMVKLLLLHGAGEFVSIKNAEGQTPLHVVLNKMWEQNAWLFAASFHEEGRRLFHVVEIIASLIKNGAHIESFDNNGQFLLKVAQGLDTYAKSYFKNAQVFAEHETLFSFMIKHRKLYIKQRIEKIIKQMAEKNTVLTFENIFLDEIDRAQNKTLIWQACYAEAFDLLQLLVPYGIEQFVVISDAQINMTPLGWACYCGNRPMIQFLLEHGAGATINGTDINGNTPLHLLLQKIESVLRQPTDYVDVLRSLLDSVVLLLQRGAEIDSRNDNYLSVGQVAQRFDNDYGELFVRSQLFGEDETLFLFLRKHRNYYEQKQKVEKIVDDMNQRKDALKLEKTFVDDRCPICIDDEDESVKVIISPCGHVMHKKCFTQSFIKFAEICSICRGNIEAITEVEEQKKD